MAAYPQTIFLKVQPDKDPNSFHYFKQHDELLIYKLQGHAPVLERKLGSTFLSLSESWWDDQKN